MRKLLSLFLTLCVAVSVFAYDAFIDGIYYNLNNYSDGSQRASVTYRDWPHNSESSNATAYSGDVIIPANVTYNGKEYVVTSIDSYAFMHCSSLTSVVIPEGVTSIGYGAFSGCSSFTTDALT